MVIQNSFYWHSICSKISRDNQAAKSVTLHIFCWVILMMQSSKAGFLYDGYLNLFLFPLYIFILAMVITVEIRKMYRYPFEHVVDMHLNKYPNPLEENVRDIKTVEEKKDITGIIYRRRIAICNNVLPGILRKVHLMNVDDVYLEEESWLDRKQKTMNIRSRCLTWTQLATLQEVSTFRESTANPNWTEFWQTGSVTVTGIGRLNRLFELFAHSFFSRAVRKSVNVMDTILEQRYGCPCS